MVGKVKWVEVKALLLRSWSTCKVENTWVLKCGAKALSPHYRSAHGSSGTCEVSPKRTPTVKLLGSHAAKLR